MLKVNIDSRFVNPNIFKIDGNILFCNLYSVNVSFNKKFQVVQHLETTKHISNHRLKEEKNTQPYIKTTFV